MQKFAISVAAYLATLSQASQIRLVFDQQQYPSGGAYLELAQVSSSHSDPIPIVNTNSSIGAGHET